MRDETIGCIFIFFSVLLYIAARVLDPHYHHVPGAEALANRATLAFLVGAVMLLGPRVKRWFDADGAQAPQD